MTRCQPCVEKTLRKLIRERDAKVNLLESENKRLTAELRAINEKYNGVCDAIYSLSPMEE